MTSVSASVSILPPGTLPKFDVPDGDLSVKIIKIYPENGYAEDGAPIPSENDMMNVEFFGGDTHEFQIKDLDKADLAAKVKNLVMGKYKIKSFDFDMIPDLAVGAEIVLKNVVK